MTIVQLVPYLLSLSCVLPAAPQVARTPGKLPAHGLHGYPRVTGGREEVKDVVSLPVSNLITRVMTNIRTWEVILPSTLRW